MAVSFSDLQLAFEFVSSGGRGENEAYLDRQSGVTVGLPVTHRLAPARRPSEYPADIIMSTMAAMFGAVPLACGALFHVVD